MELEVELEVERRMMGSKGGVGHKLPSLTGSFSFLSSTAKLYTATYQFHDKSFVTFPYVTLHVAKNRDNERR